MPSLRGNNVVVQTVVRLVSKLTIEVWLLTDVLPTTKSLSRGELSNASLSALPSAVTVKRMASSNMTGFLSMVASSEFTSA